MRTAFIRTLEALAAEDPRIWLLVGDLGFTVVEPFAKRHPHQFLNAGVAEQNMTGVATGLALSGKIVFTYSIGNFPTLRCLEQIRNDVCYHRANVKIVTIGGGYAYGPLGSSHHATEDLAILRALPEMIVIAPGDPIETEAATRAIAAYTGPCYLRLAKAGEPAVHHTPVEFRIGRSFTVRDGEDVTLIGCGAVLPLCVEVADALEKTGISVRVISMPTIKPLDVEAVLNAAQETAAILTVEEHSVVGGLGGAVAEVLAQSDTTCRSAFRTVGLPDQFCDTVGDQRHLRAKSGLSVEAIVRAAQILLSSASMLGRGNRDRR